MEQLAVLILSDEEQAELKALAGRRKTAQALALRARIVLACAEGTQNKEVAAKLGVVEMTVGKWRRRFVQYRLEGLRDEPRTGAARTIDDARIEATIVKTLESLPKDATHWSSRGMAKESRCRYQACSARVSERMCKQVSVSLPYRGDSHDCDDDNT
jgi:transposase